MLRVVEFEFHNFCNRTCEFCPNSIYPRNNYRETKGMRIVDVDVYRKFMEQLRDRGFEGTLSFSRYNEPLSFKSLLLAYTGVTRDVFKGRQIRIVSNTNGDYMWDGCLDVVDELTIMDYDNKGYGFWKERLENMGCTWVSGSFQSGQITFRSPKGKVVSVFLNFTKTATIEDRGGTLDLDRIGLAAKNNWDVRERSCQEPLYFLGVDWTGDAMPCCHMRHDTHPHMILGNVFEDGLDAVLDGDKRHRIIGNSMEANWKHQVACLRCQKDPGRYTKDNPSIVYEGERR